VNLRTALVGAANALADALERPAAVQASDWIDITSNANPAGYRQAHDAGERGELEIRKVGRRRLVRRSELDNWIASRPKVGELEPEQSNSHVAALVQAAGFRRTG
jgi:hypothetical protein